MGLVHHAWQAILRMYSYIYDLLGLGAVVNLVFRAVVSIGSTPHTALHTQAAAADSTASPRCQRGSPHADVVRGAGSGSRLLPEALHKALAQNQARLGECVRLTPVLSKAAASTAMAALWPLKKTRGWNTGCCRIKCQAAAAGFWA